MSDFVEVDVRGLSCPEPVLMVMDAMDEHPGNRSVCLAMRHTPGRILSARWSIMEKRGTPRCWKTAVSPLPLKRDAALEY